MNRDRKNLLCCLVGIVLWLVLMVSIYGFYYLPVVQEAKDKGKQEEVLKQKVAIFNSKYPAIEELNKNVMASNELLSEKIPVDMNTADFLKELNNMALLSKVELLEVKPKELVKENGCIKQEIEILVAGDFFNLLSFYKKIHTSKRLITLNSGQIYVDNDIIKSTLGINIFALSK